MHSADVCSCFAGSGINCIKDHAVQHNLHRVHLHAYVQFYLCMHGVHVHVHVQHVLKIKDSELKIL